MNTKMTMTCLGLVIALSGCASTMLSDNRLRSNTAGVLGQPENAVTITDRSDDGLTNTYYRAHTPRGVFACSANGGGLLAAGILNTPHCTRT